MSQNQELKLQILKEKISLLKSNFTVIQAQNKQLKETNYNLQKEVEEKNDKLTKLERNYKNLQLAKAVSSSSGENTEAKKNIDELIREIDRCIALLNS